MTTLSMFFPARDATAAAAAAERNVVLSVDAEARQLVSAVARGDEAAFRDLYDRYHSRLFRLTLVLGCGDESLAQDTVQAVFVTAAAKLRRVESDDHLWNWLARVARQQLAKTLRRQRRARAIICVPELPECADAVPADRMLEDRLDAAMLSLDAEDRRMLEWFYFDGLSQKEIAERINATPKAVSSRLERARAKLRSCLKRRLAHDA